MSSVPRIPKNIRFASSVQVRVGAERGFLFDQRTGKVYSLNASGAVAASCIQEGALLPKVIAAVVKAFDVDAPTARRDFARFTAQLVEEGLAEVDE
ncbi:MAG: PqqD family protein [Nitrospinota bacterium]